MVMPRGRDGAVGAGTLTARASGSSNSRCDGPAWPLCDEEASGSANANRTTGTASEGGREEDPRSVAVEGGFEIPKAKAISFAGRVEVEIAMATATLKHCSSVLSLFEEVATSIGRRCGCNSFLVLVLCLCLLDSLEP